MAKVAAATAVVAAMGIDNPLRAALVLVPAVELAAILPITPGNVGLASAAVALALGSQGVESGTALSTGIAFGAVELLTGMAIGAAGALSLAGPLVRPYYRVAVRGCDVRRRGRVRRDGSVPGRLSGSSRPLSTGWRSMLTSAATGRRPGRNSREAG